jgi:hypothetical protein
MIIRYDWENGIKTRGSENVKNEGCRLSVLDGSVV